MTYPFATGGGGGIISVLLAHFLAFEGTTQDVML